ncbi:MAG: hypothetical protein ACJ8DM_08310 [Microvirga sp.]
MGLTFDFKLIPTPSRLLLDERSHRGLSTCMDVDVLDNDLLLPTATNAGEGFHLDRKGAQKLRRHVPVRLEFLEHFSAARARAEVSQGERFCTHGVRDCLFPCLARGGVPKRSAFAFPGPAK